MRRYVLFGCGVLVLGAAAWYFGRPTPAAPRPEPPARVADLPQAEAPKQLPARVVEVIDLARAYEPVREPEVVHPGGVDPASFIQVPEVAEQIPPARDVDDPYADVIRTVREAPSGWSFWNEPDRERIDLMPREAHPTTGAGIAPWNIEPGQLQDLLHFEGELRPVRLDVMPREVPAIANGLLNFTPTPGGFDFTPMGVPYTLEDQPFPPAVSIQNGLLNFTPAAPVEQLKVRPRQVTPTVNESGPRSGAGSHEPGRYERLHGKFGP